MKEVVKLFAICYLATLVYRYYLILDARNRKPFSSTGSNDGSLIGGVDNENRLTFILSGGDADDWDN